MVYFTIIIASLIDGILEGWSFDSRKAFEIRYAVNPLGFWGSESWRRAYKNNDKKQGYKNFFTRIFGAWDFYHVGDKIRKYGYLLCGFLLIFHLELMLILIVITLSVVCKNIGMAWVRKIAKYEKDIS